MPDKLQRINIKKPLSRTEELLKLVELIHIQLQKAAASTDIPFEKVFEGIKKLVTDHFGSLDFDILLGPSLINRTSTRKIAAIRWLFFLMNDDNLKSHISSLRLAYKFILAIQNKKPFLFKVFSKPLEIKFYNFRYMFKGEHKPNIIRLTFNEAFIGAPEEIICCLVELSMKKGNKNKLKVIQNYSQTMPFLSKYNLLMPPSAAFFTSNGKYYDLAKIFKQVNEEYFENNLSLPNLGWSRRASRRKFGHYDETADAVIISKSLDSIEVPEYTIAFVMYNELLHKSLGVQKLNGRRRVHTPTFRKAEKKFQFYESANAVLKTISRS